MIWDKGIASRLLTIALCRFVSSSEEEEYLLLAFGLFLWDSLFLFFGARLLDLALGRDDPESSELSESPLELSELRLGGDLLLLDFRDRRLF